MRNKLWTPEEVEQLSMKDLAIEIASYLKDLRDDMTFHGETRNLKSVVEAHWLTTQLLARIKKLDETVNTLAELEKRKSQS